MENLTTYEMLTYEDFYFSYILDNYSADAETSIALQLCSVVLSVVFLLGILGNGLIIFFIMFKMKKTVNSVWFLSLAIADFTFLLFQPLKITDLAFNGHWPFGDLMCKLSLFVLSLAFLSSYLQLIVINIDHLACVFFPFGFQNCRTIRLAFLASLAVWILAAVFSAPYFTFYKTIPFREPFCYLDLSDPQALLYLKRVIIRLFVFFVIPFTVITSYYMVILLRIQRTGMATPTKLFKMVAAVTISFLICWLPYHVFFLMLVTTIETYYYSLRHVILNGVLISYILGTAHSCIKPFLYVFFGRDIKEKFWCSIQPALERAFTEHTDWTDPEGRIVYSTSSGTHDCEINLSPQNRLEN